MKSGDRCRSSESGDPVTPAAQPGLLERRVKLEGDDMPMLAAPPTGSTIRWDAL
jgi:hypothetical protein